MSNRLKKLWRGAVPGRTPCPCADRGAVLRRVEAALPGQRRVLRLRRTARVLAAAATALALLTATAAAGALPAFSVFGGMLRGGEPSEYELSLVDMEPRSVSNNGYSSPSPAP